ncbi:SDR family oxidoreductase [Mucilaginibacter sp. dw_454]|uniref:SDR family NAD(P)-dependent oxidoreductase n=1 Tax=Mucilaginibacter sp. dw_454 TaxID=2720079 RepID=UPI001BD61EB6|nr:SDR family oxidoreductase [Mucilaginibacter sp. dw_454]
MNVFITGGSSGLGESITRLLASDSDNTVYFTYSSSADKAKAIEADLPNAVAIKCNFKAADEVETLKDKIAGLDLDVLINNAYAGSFLKTHFHKLPADDFLSEFEQNIIPTITITQAAILAFRKKKAGKIITILTSALVNVPPVGASIYLANKAYLKQLTKVWATENSKYNITSNSVSPSFMLTRFTSDMDERIVEQMTGNHPLKKLLTTDEAAQSILQLVNASNHINGVDLIINAGMDIS